MIVMVARGEDFRKNSAIIFTLWKVWLIADDVDRGSKRIFKMLTNSGTDTAMKSITHETVFWSTGWNIICNYYRKMQSMLRWHKDE